jgi:hypothetical protein
VRLDADGKVVEKKDYPKTKFQIIHLYEAPDGKILVSGLATNMFYYLDDPGLLMGPATAIAPPAKTWLKLRGVINPYGYDAAGKLRAEASAPVRRFAP